MARLFPLGRIVATVAANEALKEAQADPFVFLALHVNGNWGDVCKADKKENDRAVKNGSRILSSCKLPVTGEKIWIITEADRSCTTILLPGDY